LNGAVDLALKQNLDIQIANIETATRQQDRVIARSELLPHASFEADESVELTRQRALAIYDDAKHRLAQRGFVHSFVMDHRLRGPQADPLPAAEQAIA
jgi:outer membrane protein TolC